MQLRELAKELGVDPERLLEKCREVGMTDVSQITDIDEEGARQIREAFGGVGPDASGGSAASVEGTGGSAGDRKKLKEDSPAEPKRAARKTPARGKTGKYVALLGVTKSGKTVFWASLVENSTEIGVEKMALLDGWRPDAPVGPARTAARNICQALLNGEPIDATDLSVYDEFSLSLHKTRMLLFHSEHEFQSHDVSGETLSRWVEGSEEVVKHIVDSLTVNVQKADGLIILIDPTRGDDILRWQDHVWRMLLDRLRKDSGKRYYAKPVVLAFTKCDMPSVTQPLGTPFLDKRIEAERNSAMYQAIVAEQDRCVRQYLQKRMRKLWTAIDRDDRQRSVRNATVMAMSSTGLSDRELKNADQLHPWRITDPFRWMLEQLEPWPYRRPYSIILKAIILLLLMVGGATAAGWQDYVARQELLRIEQRVRDFWGARQFTKALGVLDEATGESSFFYPRSRLASLRQNVERDRDLSHLKELIAKNEFVAAETYLTDRVPDHAKASCRVEILSALRKQCPGIDAAVVDGKWVDCDYATVTERASVARRLGEDEPWTAEWLHAALCRQAISRAVMAAGFATRPLDRAKHLMQASRSIAEAMREAATYKGLSNARASVSPLTPADNDGAPSDVMPETETLGLREALETECSFGVKHLEQQLASCLDLAARGQGTSLAEMDALCVVAEGLLAQPWYRCGESLLYWTVRLRMCYWLEKGNPSKASEVYETYAREMDSLLSSQRRERLLALRRAAERASDMVFFEMVSITLGDNSRSDRSAERRAEVGPYYIDKREVTKGQFSQFLAAYGYEPKEPFLFLMDWPSRRAPSEREMEHACRYVNVQDAKAYAQYYLAALPTEDEWEAAAGWDAQMKRVRTYPYGYYFVCGRTTTGDTPNLLGKSPCGCLDMAGGLWEWVVTGTGEYVLKGGCWMNLKTLGEKDLADTTRVASRRRDAQTERTRQYGFRCVIRPRELRR